MKQQVTFSMFVDAFRSIRPDNFSYEALRVMFDYFEQLEEDTGEQIDLDVIDICCNFSECDTKDFDSMGVSEDSIIGSTSIDTVVFVC